MTKISLLILTIIAALATSGIPLAIVQMGAWVNMFDEFYEETKSVSVSVEWTLNGERSCSVCQFVSKQNDSSDKSFKTIEIFSHKLKLSPPVSEKITLALSKVVGILNPAEVKGNKAYISMELPPPRSIVLT